jgi:hypothetical protein
MPSSSFTLLNFSVKILSRNNGHFTFVVVAEICLCNNCRGISRKKRGLRKYIYQRKEKWIKKKKTIMADNYLV